MLFMDVGFMSADADIEIYNFIKLANIPYQIMRKCWDINLCLTSTVLLIFF